MLLFQGGVGEMCEWEDQSGIFRCKEASIDEIQERWRMVQNNLER